MLGELSDEQIESVLASQMVGRLGCHAEGVTYVVPVSYAYDGSSVFGHTGEGMKVRMMRANPSVCFEVERIDGPANWQSVIAWGTYRELAGEAADEALARLVSRMMRMLASSTGTHFHGLEAGRIRSPYTVGRAAVVYAIDLTRRTGRFERA